MAGYIGKGKAINLTDVPSTIPKDITVNGDFTSTGTVDASAYTQGGQPLEAGAKEGIFWENSQTITSNYTITSGKNAGTFGPVTIADGVTVTIPDGSTWTIV